MEQVLVDIQRTYMDIHLTYLQSNHEGDLIDWMQKFGLKYNEEARPKAKDIVDGIILNAGGYTHTSVALRDAVICCQVPIVEVHISDITQREDFRRISLLTDVCTHSIIGHGTNGYKEAIEWIIQHKHEE
jgi:3-dehydroquinate dehydratase-2